jgi:inhibitor of cysteine peptidase
MQILTQKADGQRVALAISETAELRLPENATTGYRWQLADADASVVAVEEAPGAYPGGAVGSGGTAIFHVTGRAAGSAEVSFACRRAWEDADKAADRFSFSVDVG